MFYTDNTLYTDNRYNDTIRYNDKDETFAQEVAISHKLCKNI